MPGSQVPGSQMPGSQMPGSQIPGSQMPGSQIPGSQIPGSQIPGCQIPPLPPGWAAAKLPGPPTPILQVQFLSSKAKAPTRGSEFAAGYDLYSSEDTIVPARGQAMVSTDISIAVPNGTCKFPPPKSRSSPSFPSTSLPPDRIR
jgi:hypothetical protein